MKGEILTEKKSGKTKLLFVWEDKHIMITFGSEYAHNEHKKIIIELSNVPKEKNNIIPGHIRTGFMVELSKLPENTRETILMNIEAIILLEKSASSVREEINTVVDEFNKNVLTIF